jgi:hypothetical protein
MKMKTAQQYNKRLDDIFEQAKQIAKERKIRAIKMLNQNGFINGEIVELLGCSMDDVRKVLSV